MKKQEVIVISENLGLLAVRLNIDGANLWAVIKKDNWREDNEYSVLCSSVELVDALRIALKNTSEYAGILHKSCESFCKSLTGDFYLTRELEMKSDDKINMVIFDKKDGFCPVTVSFCFTHE